MKKAIAILIIISIMLGMAGCTQESGDQEEYEPSMHIMFMPNGTGGLTPIPIFY